MDPGESRDDAAEGARSVPADAPSGFDLAYSITYRLLGDEALARSAARTVADRPGYEAHDGLRVTSESARDWDTCSVAADAVAVSLLSEPLLSGTHTSHELRDSLRRRLAALDDTSRAAVALHHLAGVDLDHLARLLELDPAEVAEICEPFAPPAGVRYEDLGDPGPRADPVIRARRGTRRHVPVIPLVVLGVAGILILWASSASGPRPTLGAPSKTPASLADTAAIFDESADPLPSAGCPADSGSVKEAGVDAPGVSSAAVKVGSNDVHYRLYKPSTPGARPLVVAVPTSGQSAEAFQETAKLEAGLPEDMIATLDTMAPEQQSDAVVAVTDALAGRDCVDLRRITVVGYGTGATAAGRSTCSSPEIFAGVAMVAGWATPEHCKATPPVSALLGANADNPVMGADGSGLDDATKSWAELAGAGSSEVEAVGDDILINRWTGEGGVKITSMWRDSGGTAWSPGDTLAVVEFVTHTARVVG